MPLLRRTKATAILAAISLFAASSSALADSDKQPKPSPIPWPETSHSPQWYDYTIMAGGMGAALAWNFGIQPGDRGWGTFAPDETIRNLLRFRSEESRSVARNVSDVLYWSGFGIPIIETLVLLPIDYRTSLKVFVMQVESLAVMGQALILLERTTGRARPCKQEVTGCGAPDALAGNQTAEDFKSFPSGHTAILTAGTMLSCLEHYRLGILQKAPLDIAYCALMGTMSVAGGVLRMNADRHYMTDTVVGWGAGLGTAFLVDYLWHGKFQGYAQGRAEHEPKNEKRPRPIPISQVHLSPWMDAQGGGLMLGGSLGL